MLRIQIQTLKWLLGGGGVQNISHNRKDTTKYPKAVLEKKPPPFWKAILKDDNFNAVQFHCVEIILV